MNVYHVVRKVYHGVRKVYHGQSSIISHWIDCLRLEQGWISQTSLISNYGYRQTTDDRVTGTPVEASLRDGLIIDSSLIEEA